MILVKMRDFEEKLEVLRNKNKLRGIECYIDNDMTKEERSIQATLRRRAKEEKEKGYTVRVGYRKIQINGSQLTAEAESFQNSAPVEDRSQSLYEYTSGTVPTRAYKWNDGNLCFKISNWSPVSLANNNKLPHELFQDLVDAEIIDSLVEHSNRYAARRNKLGDITIEEMKCFLGKRSRSFSLESLTQDLTELTI
ncbi:hypothetical protein C0J52_21061 [Blattella germanica]|nr:hypothetical protein C0J52_21061 [Blattella germanica]